MKSTTINYNNNNPFMVMAALTTTTMLLLLSSCAHAEPTTTTVADGHTAAGTSFFLVFASVAGLALVYSVLQLRTAQDKLTALTVREHDLQAELAAANARLAKKAHKAVDAADAVSKKSKEEAERQAAGHSRREMESKLRELQEQVTHMSAAQSDFKRQLQARDEELDRRKKQMATLEERAAGFVKSEQKCKAASEAQRKAEAQVRHLTEESEEGREAIKEANRLREQVAKLEAQARQAQSLRAELKAAQDKAALVPRLQERIAEVEKASEGHARAATTANALEKEVAQLRGEVEAARKAEHDASSHLSAANAKLAASEKQVSELNKRVEGAKAAEAAKAAAEEEVVKARSLGQLAVIEMRKEMDAQQGQLSDLAAQVAAAKANEASHKKKVEQLEHQVAEAKEAAAAAEARAHKAEQEAQKTAKKEGKQADDRVRKLEQEVEKAKQHSTQLAEAVAAAEKRNESLSKQVETAQGEAQQARKEAKEATQKATKAAKDKDHADGEVARLTAAVADLERKVSSAAAAAASSSPQTKGVDPAKHAELQAQVAKLTDQIVHLDTESGKWQATAAEREAEIKALKKSLQDATAKEAALKQQQGSQASSLETALKTKTEEVEAGRAALATSRDRISALEAQLQKVESEHKKEAQEIARVLEKRLQTMEAEETRVQARVATLEKEDDLLRSKIRDMAAKEATWGADRSILEAHIKKADAEIADLKHQLSIAHMRRSPDRSATPSSKGAAGIGLHLADGRHGIVVQSIVANSPADACKAFREGDVVVEVDSTDARGLMVQDVSRLIIGERGTPVRLTIERGGKRSRINVIREAALPHSPPPRH